MKILKYLLYVLLGLILIVIILGLLGPKSYDVSRSAVLNGTPAQVWPFVSALDQMEVWSPWAHKDSTMTVEHTGTEGTVGSISKWDSKKMGKGEQSITALDRPKAVETHLKFYMPWGTNEADSYTMLADTAGKTKVTWGVRGKNDFISRIFGSLMSFDKAMGKDFEEGLANLSKLVDAAPKEKPMDLIVGTIDYEGGKYLAVRREITMDKMKPFFEEYSRKVMDELKKAQVETNSMVTGMYYTWDESHQTTDMAVGVSFKGDLKKLPVGMSILNVPASKALMVDYRGDYRGIPKAHFAIDNYLKEYNLKAGDPVLEEYITGPMMEPDSAKWLTRILYLIKS